MTEEAHYRFEKLEPTLRTRILDAALMEFGRYGYGSASMNRLVRNAGISKGALFKYFGTKAALFEYVYRTTLKEVKGQLRAVRDESRTEPFFNRLEKVIRTGVDFTTRRPFSASVYYRFVYTGDAPNGNRILSEIHDSSRNFLRSLIEEGIKNGELGENIDSQKSAFIIQSVLDSLLKACYLHCMNREAPVHGKIGNHGPFSDFEMWVGEIMEFFRNGLNDQTGRKEQ